MINFLCSCLKNYFGFYTLLMDWMYTELLGCNTISEHFKVQFNIVDKTRNKILVLSTYPVKT